jgi:hypothetical protein
MDENSLSLFCTQIINLAYTFIPYAHDGSTFNITLLTLHGCRGQPFTKNNDLFL